MKETAIYDIYVMDKGCVPRLVEKLEGLSRAKQRMAELAAQSPGKYYLWNAYGLEMISTLDNTRR